MTNPPLVIDPIAVSTGIGDVSFGTPLSDVLPAAATAFGDPIAGPVVHFETRQDDGTFTDGTMVSVFEYGSSSCYSNGLCLYFGGDNDDPLTHAFVGWTQVEGTGPALAAKNGLTIGSTFADFPRIKLTPGPCANEASGTSSKLRLKLTSDSAMYDPATSTPVDPQPDPSTIKVVTISSGEVPVPLNPPAC